MIYAGEEKLKRQAESGFPKGITKICDNVYFALGYGGSTCTLVIGENSCIPVSYTHLYQCGKNLLLSL